MRWLVAAATLLPGLAGCILAGEASVTMAWTPLDCDPEAARVNQDAPRLPTSTGSARSFAESMSNAVPDPLLDAGTKLEWGNSYLWMTADGHIVVEMADDATEIDTPGVVRRAHYHGATPWLGETEVHVRHQVPGFLRRLGIPSYVDLEYEYETIGSRSLQLSFEQRLGGGVLEESHGYYSVTEKNSVFVYGPLYDLRHASLELGRSTAYSRASAYMECVLDSEGTPHLDVEPFVEPRRPFDLLSIDGSLAYDFWMDFDVLGPRCMRRVQVDVVTGAVLGHEDVGSCHIDWFPEMLGLEIMGPAKVQLESRATFQLSASTDSFGLDGATWSIRTGNSSLGVPAILNQAPRANGTGIPANVTLSFNETGLHTVVASAQRGAQSFGPDIFEVEVVKYHVPGVDEPILFFDGAENGTSGWTIAGETVLGGIATGIPREGRGWATSTMHEVSGNASFWSDLPDSWRGTMTSPPIEVPPAEVGSHQLRFMLRGGGGNGGVGGADELAVLVDTAIGRVALLADHGSFTDWTPVSLDLQPFSGTAISIIFQVTLDSGCSVDAPTVPLCSPPDAWGYYVDNIVVL